MLYIYQCLQRRILIVGIVHFIIIAVVIGYCLGVKPSFGEFPIYMNTSGWSNPNTGVKEVHTYLLVSLFMGEFSSLLYRVKRYIGLIQRGALTTYSVQKDWLIRRDEYTWTAPSRVVMMNEIIRPCTITDGAITFLLTFVIHLLAKRSIDEGIVSACDITSVQKYIEIEDGKVAKPQSIGILSVWLPLVSSMSPMILIFILSRLVLISKAILSVFDDTLSTYVVVLVIYIIVECTAATSIFVTEIYLYKLRTRKFNPVDFSYVVHVDTYLDLVDIISKIGLIVFVVIHKTAPFVDQVGISSE
jgi:hypothetical protein